LLRLPPRGRVGMPGPRPGCGRDVKLAGHDTRSTRPHAAQALAAGLARSRARPARAARDAGTGAGVAGDLRRCGRAVPAAGTARVRGPDAPWRPGRPAAAPGTAAGR